MPNQRDIVEVPYLLPQERVELHPAIIISTEDLQNCEGGFYAVLCSSEEQPEEYSLQLTPDMINGKPMTKTTYVKAHMIQWYRLEDVRRIFGNVKVDAFQMIEAKIVESIFGEDNLE